MQRTKRKVLRNIIQFIKLQLAGNILFWGTYLGYAIGHELLGWNSLLAMSIGSLGAHVVFFIVDKNWVFNTSTGQRKTTGEIGRFAVFMGLNFFLNLGIVTGLERYFQVSPYIGQFVAGAFFTVWSYLGLKFWVFRSGEIARHQAITLETKKSKEKSRAHSQRLAAKQKAKRTTRLHR